MKARDNPFATDRVMRLRYRLDGIEWEELLGRLERMRYRGALVGPKGRGKTTLLEDLEPHLERRGFRIRRIQLYADGPAMSREGWAALTSDVSASDFILLDGAEQLSWWGWRRFRGATALAGGLVATTHRPGRLPTLWTCRTDEALLRSMMAELTGMAPGSIRVEAGELFRRHGGNIREALRECYDRWAVGISRSAYGAGFGSVDRL